MSAVDDILREIPLNQLASQLGTDEATAQQAVSQAVPMLVQGMQSNAGDPAGEQALAGALDQHAMSPLFGGGENSVDLNQVDTNEGQKIVNHIFGGQDINALAGQYGAMGGAQSGMMQKLLPILAPIVMAYLAKRLLGGGAGRGGSGSILGDLMGGMLGGGMGGLGGAMGQQGGMGGLGGAMGQQGGMGGLGGLGGLLGGLLGGGGGAMGGLGGLLGGGQQEMADQQTYGQDRFNQQQSYLPGGQQAGQYDASTGPFNTGTATDAGEIRIDDPNANDSGTNVGQDQAQQGQQHEGGLMGTLRDMFGGGDNRR